jgi:hypothetical protein
MLELSASTVLGCLGEDEDEDGDEDEDEDGADPRTLRPC